MITVLVIGLITLGLFLAQRELYHKYWNHRVYASVAFESDGIACGEPSAVIEVVENRKRLPLPMIKVKFQTSRELHFTSGKGSRITDRYYRNDVFHLKGYEKITRRVEFVAARRGFYEIREMDLVGSDLFMSDQFVSALPVDTGLIVYPRERAFPSLDHVFVSLLGMQGSRRSLVDDPFSFRGLRAYQPGDSERLVNWRASARTEELLVNQREYVSMRPVHLYLNLLDDGVLKHEDWAEDMISAASYLAGRFYRNGTRISLDSNACDCFRHATIHLSSDRMPDYEELQSMLALIDLKEVRPVDFAFDEHIFAEDSDELPCFLSLHLQPEFEKLLMHGVTGGHSFLLILPSARGENLTIPPDLEPFVRYLYET